MMRRNRNVVVAEETTAEAANLVRDVLNGAEQLERDTRHAARAHAKRMERVAQREARLHGQPRAVTTGFVAREARKQAERVMKEAEERTGKTLLRHEKTLQELEAQVMKLSKPRRRSGGGSLLWLGALVGGAYYLARQPHVRHRVLDIVEQYSPEARDWLHNAGRQASRIAGSVWLEQDEETPPPPRAAVAAPSPAVTATPSPLPTQGGPREADRAPTTVPVVVREPSPGTTGAGNVKR